MNLAGDHPGASSSTEAGPAGLLDDDPEIIVLLELWALGLIPASTLQQIGNASNIVAPRPAAAALAALGTHGAYKGNIHRDLMKQLQLTQDSLAKPLHVKLTVWNKAARPPACAEVNWPILLPHELLASLYSGYKDEFDKFWLGSAPLASWWGHVPDDDPRLQGHPVRRLDNFRNRVIPIRLHGDGVPVGKAKGRSMDLLTINSLTGNLGSSWDRTLMLVAMIDSIKTKGGPNNEQTMDKVWNILLWSFACCLQGTWPRLDWNKEPLQGWRAERAGQDLVGGYCFMIYLVSADLDYLCNYMRLRHFNAKAGGNCMHCCANRAGVPWSDLRPTAI